MKEIFYLLTLVGLFKEVYSLYYPEKILGTLSDLDKVKKGEMTFSQVRMYPTWIDFLYIVWTFAGLFTFQWPVFLFLILLGFVPKKKLWYIRFDAILCIILLLFIVINAWHLNIKIL